MEGQGAEDQGVEEPAHAHRDDVGRDVARDVVRDVVRDAVRDVVRDVVPDVVRDVVPDVVRDVVPDVVRDVAEVLPALVEGQCQVRVYEDHVVEGLLCREDQVCQKSY